jgi:hypothetical protein
MWIDPISNVAMMEDEPLTGGLDENNEESPHDEPIPRLVS